jgi:Arc/MetJ family transcription regulator
MRTTLTLDPDVLRLVQNVVHRERKTMKEVVNEALRRALREPTASEPYTLTPHHSGLRPGLDAARLNQLSDEIDTESRIEHMTRALD